MTTKPLEPGLQRAAEALAAAIIEARQMEAQLALRDQFDAEVDEILFKAACAGELDKQPEEM